jgi:carboxyl-terminal processing protease
VPDIEVLQDVPDELKSRTDTKGEASLRGHLKNDGDEKTGSQSYVPPDAKDDKALKMADDLLHGVKVNPSAAANGDKAANDTPAAASTESDPVATRKPN